MSRHLLTLALAGVFGALVASDASACCHKKKAACPAPATCVAEAPAPPPAPVCAPAPTCAPAPKKHCKLFGGGGKKMFGGLCHKKQAATCAPVAYEAPAYAPTYYPSPQASPQASGQGY